MTDLDIGLAPLLPTKTYTDAQAVVDGHMGERMPKASRWLGTRYAMIWHGEAANIIRLRKIGADENCADIFTKCLTSEAFRRNRARVLGLPYTPIEPPKQEAPQSHSRISSRTAAKARGRGVAAARAARAKAAAAAGRGGAEARAKAACARVERAALEPPPGTAMYPGAYDR